MKVKELKEILNNCPDDAEVVMPVWDEEHVEDINHLWKISTAAIIHQYDENEPALLLNTNNGELTIASQLNNYNPLELTCEKGLK